MIDSEKIYCASSTNTIKKKGVFCMYAGSSSDWNNMPSDWTDIRVNCPDNCIALYAAHKADYSSYDNLGFTVSTSGGSYKVYIDGQYYNAFNSGSQCNIVWSNLALTTGDDITTPAQLKAHIIHIYGNGDITAFHCARVATSGTEQQGLLWAHYNITNGINCNTAFGNSDVSINNQILRAITSKNNILKVITSTNSFVRACVELIYLPEIGGQNDIISDTVQSFSDCYKLQKLKLKNFEAQNLNTFLRNARALTSFPKNMIFSSARLMSDFLTNAINLKNTVLDLRQATLLRRLGCYGTSQYFMSGFKGLCVSNEAPFDNATPPQINVSYTGMDRDALIQLFNDLPTVNAGQIIKITGCTGTADLTATEIGIATTKGWTVSV